MIERDAEGLDELPDPPAVARQRSERFGRNRYRRRGASNRAAIEHERAKSRARDLSTGDTRGSPFRGLCVRGRHESLLAPQYAIVKALRQVRKVCQFRCG